MTVITFRDFPLQGIVYSSAGLTDGMILFAQMSWSCRVCPRQIEEERFQREQRREHERMEKFLQKQSRRVSFFSSFEINCNPDMVL